MSDDARHPKWVTGDVHRISSYISARVAPGRRHHRGLCSTSTSKNERRSNGSATLTATLTATASNIVVKIAVHTAWTIKQCVDGGGLQLPSLHSFRDVNCNLFCGGTATSKGLTLPKYPYQDHLLRQRAALRLAGDGLRHFVDFSPSAE
jgi:hypothetical protein